MTDQVRDDRKISNIDFCIAKMQKECDELQSLGIKLTPMNILGTMLRCDVVGYELITGRAGRVDGVKVTISGDFNRRLFDNINFKNDIFDLQLELTDKKLIEDGKVNGRTQWKSVTILILTNKLNRSSVKAHREAIVIGLSLFDEEVRRDDMDTIRLLNRVQSYTNPQSEVGMIESPRRAIR